MPLGRPYRLVILGTTRVGKTALVEHLIFGNHVVGLDGVKTLGDIYEAVIETEHPAAEAVQLFDTPGDLFMLEPSKDESHYDQEHYMSIADGFVLVYDITSRSSYDIVLTIKHKISMRHRECPVVVIGNKYDLDGIRDVDVNVSTQWAKTNGVRLYETSVLDRNSLKEPFTYITWCVANPDKYKSSLHVVKTVPKPFKNGRPLPAFLQSFPPAQVSRQKSFTIPPTKKYSGHEPLIANPNGSNPPSPEVPDPHQSEKKSEEADLFATFSPQFHSSQLTIKSTSTTFSESSVESRISTKLCPDDATYPRGGLLGLADCMSNRNKDRR